jgi:hypothetical protein
MLNPINRSPKLKVAIAAMAIEAKNKMKRPTNKRNIHNCHHPVLSIS